MPDLRPGLSLTGRLILEIARETGPPTSGRAFGKLTRNREPLPHLGDAMFRWMARSHAAGICLLRLEAAPEDEPWFRAAMDPTAMGACVEWWETNRLDLGQRWLGGVVIPAERATWCWDAQTDGPVWAKLAERREEKGAVQTAP